MALLVRDGRVIENKADDMMAQRAGYDFMMDGERCEFKYDTQINRTGNIVCETISNVVKATPGCFETSTARWLFYLDTVGGICYQIDLPKLRDEFKADRRPRRMVRCQTEGKYETESALVEIGFLRRRGHECIAREIRIN